MSSNTQALKQASAQPEADPASIIYDLALSHLPHVGALSFQKIIKHFGSAQAAFEHGISGASGFTKIQKYWTAKHKALAWDQALRIYDACQSKGIQLVSWGQSAYPPRLMQAYDPPAILYVKGRLESHFPRVLAIVGTRKASEYGKSMIKEFLQSCPQQGLRLVSGLAFGIDACAHLEALRLELPNDAVMAGGFDHIYPSAHRKWAQHLLEQGAWFSEHPPHAYPDARHFPMRNRIIAGLSDAVWVVEAAQKGGALITATYANNYHREVFALPGNLHQSSSQGCNALIRDHQAVIYTGWEDLFLQMNWATQSPKPKAFKAPLLDAVEAGIVAFLQRHPNGHWDELSVALNLPAPELSQRLMEMEFRGLIKACAGDRYLLV